MNSVGAGSHRPAAVGKTVPKKTLTPSVPLSQ